MTDRLKGLVVSFDKEYREDDAKSIIDAILMVKGVANVTTSLDDHDDWINRDRIKRELEKKLWDALK